MMLNIELPEEEITVLQAKADAKGMSAEEHAGQLLSQSLAASATRMPLAQRIRNIWAEMPDDVRAKLHPDGASEHDHYIYGVPNRRR